MLTVVIEISTERGVIGVVDYQDGLGQLLGHERLPFGYQNSKYLIPSLQKMLANLGMAPKEMGYITLGIGPGSYTGMRVGAAVAKAWGYAHHLPLVGVSSLMGFIPPLDGYFAAMIDAKIGGVYFLKGHKENGLISYEGTAALVPLSALCDELKGISQWISPAPAQLRVRFEQSCPECQGTWIEDAPDVKHMADCGWSLYQAGQVSSPEAIELLYLRKTQAEIERDQRIDR